MSFRFLHVIFFISFTVRVEAAGGRPATVEPKVLWRWSRLLLAEPPEPGPGAYSLSGGASCASQQHRRLSCVCVRRGRLQDLCMPLKWANKREMYTLLGQLLRRQRPSITNGVFFFPLLLLHQFTFRAMWIRSEGEGLLTFPFLFKF